MGLKTAGKRPIPTPLSQRKDHFKRVLVPLVVWTCAAVIVAYQLYERTSRFEYVGMARADEYVVSTEYPGRIESVSVRLYDPVREGQTVVRLNDDSVLARIATSSARIDRLTAEMDAARASFMIGSTTDHLDWIADLRRFQVDEERLRLAILDLQVEIESDRIELERRTLELERFRRMVEERLISSLEYDTIRLQTEQMRKRIDETLRLLEQTREEYARATERREEFERSAPGPYDIHPVIESLRRAVSVETRILEEIRVERQALTLRSPVAGRIIRIECGKGQSVSQGQPILSVSETEVREIVAYLPETEAARIRPRSAVSISSRRPPGSIMESQVLRIGPAVELLPQRLWRDPVIPDYGYGVIIAAAPDFNLLPGELVDVRFSGD